MTINESNKYFYNAQDYPYPNLDQKFEFGKDSGGHYQRLPEAMEALGLIPKEVKLTVRQAILSEASEYISKDRNTSYGEPESNFGLIANLWNAYLGGPKEVFQPHDVAVLMSLVKVARIKTSPYKKDNWVDGAGYMACGAEVASVDNGGFCDK